MKCKIQSWLGGKKGIYYALGCFFLGWLLLVASGAVGPLPVGRMFVVGPAGEEAYFQLTSETVTVPQGADIEVRALLNTCANATACGAVSAADLSFTFDPTKLQARTADGSDTTTQIQWGNLFNYMYPKADQGQHISGSGSVYVSGYMACDSLPGEPICTPPAPYNSSGKSPEGMTFLKLRLRALAASGSTTLAVQGGDSTADWTNILLPIPSGNPIDIVNQGKALGGSGNLTVNFTAPHPATLSLQAATTAPEVGKQYEVDLVLNTAGVKASGVDATIDYNSDKLKIDNIDWPRSAANFGEFPVMTNDEDEGRIEIKGFSTPASGTYPSGTFTVVKITYTPLQTGMAQMDILFNEPGVTAADSNVSFYSEVTTTNPIDLLGGVENLALQVVPAGGATVTPSPSPTPTPTGGSGGTAELLLRLRGVSSRPANDKAINVKVWGTSLDGGAAVGSSNDPLLVACSPDDQGVYHGALALGADQVSHHYRLRIKGPKHLQEVFSDVLLAAGEVDLTGTNLRIGDINQNAVVNAEDLELVRAHMKISPTVEDLEIGDTNYDNKVNAYDAAYILQTLSAYYDPE